MNIQPIEQQVSFFDTKNRLIKSNIIRNYKINLNENKIYHFPETTIVKVSIYANNNYYSNNINELRGYINERFSDKSSYYQNTDFRLNLFKFNAGLVSAKFRIFSGFDCGIFWLNKDNLNKWHSCVGGGIYVKRCKIIHFTNIYF